MQKLSKSWILLFLLAFFYSGNTQAEVHSGIWWVSAYELPTPATNVGGIGILGGAGTLEYMLLPFLGIETGLILQPTMLNNVLKHHIVVPLMLRLWLTESFTVAGGAFYSYQATNIAENLATANYGYRAMVGIHLPYTKEKDAALALELGYQYSQLNLSRVVGASFFENQVVFMLGFRFSNMPRSKVISHNKILPSLPYVLASPPSVAN